MSSSGARSIGGVRPGRRAADAKATDSSSAISPGRGAFERGALEEARACFESGLGVAPRDPRTFAFVTLLLSAVAVVASAVPALRAARVDPLEAIRSE